MHPNIFIVSMNYLSVESNVPMALRFETVLSRTHFFVLYGTRRYALASCRWGRSWLSAGAAVVGRDDNQ